MATFAYRAVTAQGEAREGTIEAASATEAGRRVSESGLIVLSVQAGALPSKARRPSSRPTLRRKSVFGEKELTLFTRELAVLLKAGLPLDNALGVLGQVTAEPAVVETVHAVRDGVRGGRPADLCGAAGAGGAERGWGGDSAA